MSLRAAFIGVGGISPVHLNVLKELPDVEIVGLCDLDAKRLAERQAEYGGRVYHDHNVMLDTEKPDAVWLCTPPLVRRAPLLDCARRGIPVFCEKPAERSLADARSLADELDALGGHVQVGYVFRATPQIQQLRAAIADDRIHTVQSYYGSNMGLTLSFAPWFYIKAKSGGGLVDQATHNFDLLRYLFGEVVAVQGMAHNPVHPKSDTLTTEETHALTFRFANGTLGTHVHSWVARGWKNEIYLQGEKREYQLQAGKLLTIREGAESKEYPVGPESMYSHQNLRFLEHVRSGDWSDCISTYRDAVNTLAWTVACEAAIETGSTVPVDLG